MNQFSPEEMATALVHLLESTTPSPAMLHQRERTPLSAPFTTFPRENDDMSARAALMALFEATGGPQWKRKDGWGHESVSVCDWTGVGCDENQMVTSIYLESNNLKEEIPLAFFETTNDGKWPLGVTYVDLGSNALCGVLHEEWIAFADLQRFSLERNQIGGNLPVAWSSMKWEQVYLARNALTGTLPDEWSEWNVIMLLLSYNQLSGMLPSSWGDLSSSVQFLTLDLSFNAFSGGLPSSWRKMDVHILYLNNNQLEGVLPGMWYTMKTGLLFLNNNKLEGTIPNVWKLMDVIALDVSHNKLLGPLPMLPLTINHADLSYNQFSGPLLDMWNECTMLKILNVEHNTLSGTLPSSWSALADMREIRLGSNQFEGVFPFSWNTMNGLRILDLSNNKLSKVFVEGEDNWRTYFPQLSELYAQGNTLQEFWCPELCDTLVVNNYIRPLLVLDVSNNEITACPKTLGCALIWLDISNNPMEGDCQDSGDNTWFMTQGFTTSTIEIWYARNTSLSGLSTPLPRALRLLDIRNSSKLSVLDEDAPTGWDFFAASNTPMLRTHTMVSPTALSNGVYQEYAGTSVMLPNVFSYGGLSDTVENGHTMPYRCPQILSKTNSVSVGVEPHYYDYWACACVPGTQGLPPFCEACMENMDCRDLGSVCPQAMPGYWIDYEESGPLDVPASSTLWKEREVWKMCKARPDPRNTSRPLILRCSPVDYKTTACNPHNTTLPVWRNNTCVYGYEGRMCSACIQGFAHSGTRCLRCDHRVTWLYTTLLTVAFMAALTWLLRKPSSSREARTDLVLFVMQAVAQLDLLSVPTPQAVQAVLPPLLQWARLGLVKPECFGLTLGGELMMSMASPYVLGLIPFVLYVRLRRQSVGQRRSLAVATRYDELNAKYQRALALSFYGTYVPVAAQSFRFLRCDPRCSGVDKGCLLFANYYPCPWKAEQGLVALVLVGFIVHTGSIMWLLWMAYRGMDTFKFLVLPYREGFVFWEWISMGVKIVFSVGIGLLGLSNPVFVPLIGSVMIVYTATIWRWKPYFSPSMNRGATLMIAVVALIFCASSLLLIWPSDASHPEILGPIVSGVTVLLVTGSGGWLIWSNAGAFMIRVRGLSKKRTSVMMEPLLVQ